MKVVFLDIDGVLNSQRTCIAFGGFPHETTGFHREMFDEVAVSLIRGIVNTAQAKIVLSSSWRISNPFKDVGVNLRLPIIDATPSLTGPRGAEIAVWLAAHPEVEQYAIVDDDDDMLDGQLSRFVHTSGMDGFTWQNASQLAELLGISIFDVNHPRLKQAGDGLAWSKA
jgi:hypothetical protein